MKKIAYKIVNKQNASTPRNVREPQCLLAYRKQAVQSCPVSCPIPKPLQTLSETHFPVFECVQTVPNKIFLRRISNAPVQKR